MQAQTMDLPSQKGWLMLYRWCGISGYVLAPCNVIAAYEFARGWSLVGNFEGLWPFVFPWALLALACVVVKDPAPQHRVYRLGLVLGLATWLAPITSFVIWR